MKAKQSYKYTALKDINCIGEDYNFYGIVYDATFPAYSAEEKSYFTVIKLIDDSLNFLGEAPASDKTVVTVVIKARDPQNLPHIHDTCTIVRIHRGFYKPSNCNTVYVDLTHPGVKSSSFITVKTESKAGSRAKVVQSSSKEYTFESFDRKRVSELIRWRDCYYCEHEAISYPFTLSVSQSVNAPLGFDLIGKILNLQIENDKVVLVLTDGSGKVELHLDKYFNFLEEGQICRVRGLKQLESKAFCFEDNGNVLILDRNLTQCRKLRVAGLKEKEEEKESLCVIETTAAEKAISVKEVTESGVIKMKVFKIHSEGEKVSLVGSESLESNFIFEVFVDLKETDLFGEEREEVERAVLDEDSFIKLSVRRAINDAGKSVLKAVGEHKINI